MNRRGLRLGAALGAGALTMLAATPAFAATTVSQATATAINVSIAGNGSGSGTVKAVNDGTGEKKTGETNPPLQVLGQQSILNEGVLAQEATAVVSGGDGVSAACAGVAGQGGSVAQVGDSSCLSPGDPIDLALGSIYLSKVQLIVPGSALDPLTQLNVIPTTLADNLITPLSDALADTPLGTTGISATGLDAVAGYCRATPGTATADADIADLQIVADIAGQKVTLLNFPASVAPKAGGTDLLVNLDTVTDALLGPDGAVTKELQSALSAPGTTGPLAQLALLPQTVQDQVIEQVVKSLRDPLLKQLSDNVLKVTLNNRTFGDNGASVHETALDVQALPVAATSPLGTSLAGVTIGDVTCGPNGKVAAPQASPTPSAKPGPKPQKSPVVPTVVDSGQGGDHTQALTILGATGALVLLAGATGLAGYRRLLQK